MKTGHQHLERGQALQGTCLRPLYLEPWGKHGRPSPWQAQQCPIETPKYASEAC